MRLQKEQQIETTKKNSIKLQENAVEDINPYFAPQNMSNWSFLKRQNAACDFSLMRLGNKYTERISKTFMFSETIVFRVMKAISYKMNQLNRFIYSSTGIAWDLKRQQEDVSRLKKECQL